jgi:hypothetical protein
VLHYRVTSCPAYKWMSHTDHKYNLQKARVFSKDFSNNTTYLWLG